MKSRNVAESALIKMKPKNILKNGYKEKSIESSFNKQSVTFRTIDENISLRENLQS